MKLHFKEQSFQVEAVKAVVDCFEGQPLKTNRFTLERSRELRHMARKAAQGVLSMDLELETEIGYRNGSIQITDEQVLENIKRIQQQNNLHLSKMIERPKGASLGYNLTVEMETGTGKTYVYIRTMYELFKHYGWSKYIVVVPSIAIREGVYKTFEVTKEHFQEIYGHQVSPFIYNSSNPEAIEDFGRNERISVMIINTQAFSAPQYNKSTGELSNQKGNIIYREMDRFGSRRPIDIIASTNPILIIDEPQSVGKQGSKTLASMQAFNPLITLRYSATHAPGEEYNKVYRLDALDAYHKRLVKKIQVKGITQKGTTGTDGYLYLESISLSSTKPPYALLEFEMRVGDGVKRIRRKLEEGQNLFDLSKQLPAYKNHTITEINGYHNKVVIGGREIVPGEIVNYTNELDFRRVQIRETIKSHMDKERMLFSKGVKVLSLFFIDTVANYRVYNESGEQEAGVYAKIFEEEYNKVRSTYLNLFDPEYNEYLYESDPSKVHKGYMPKGFLDYLQRDDASKVHEGYFSVDKQKKMVDPSVRRGSDDSEDESAYDLIMREKERLMQFDEPVRFIFSHSALKEGWDNPNVFQICALKQADAGSQTRRRQEVGRGMRICVNQQGQRLDAEVLGDQVHEINKLTVVASESYESFAVGLQKEIAESLKDRPNKANVTYFIGKMIQDAEGNNYRISDDDASTLNKMLFGAGIIDMIDRITPEGRERIEKAEIPIPEKLKPYAEAIQGMLMGIYTGEEVLPVDERKTIVLELNKNFEKEAFQALWKRINLKSIYEVRFDTNKLIADAIVLINAQLHIAHRSFEVRTGELEDGDRKTLEAGEQFRESRRHSVSLSSEELNTTAVYDIVGEIENRTELKRSTVAAILKGIKADKFHLLRRSPEMFISRCSNFINEAKSKLIIHNIVYHRTDERYDATTVFTNDKTALRNSTKLQKHIYDFLTTDSTIEQRFAEALDNSAIVSVYAKLPKTFYILTPNGRYSPDWAIVFEKESVKYIYFVAETKGSDSDMDLKGIEALKIHCAKGHFEAISNGEVRFERVSGYDTLLEMVQA